ncbi:phosphatase PAP2 family protein [Streptomyces sp. NA04227]|uniref:phosphatase PAP2 family protein n=1 Tax=Streptomyces sp. NA04227 TaxID=2742136 RepID=UPI001591F852|nr:phosphatase PAP2 family protein [Streptomyces sp. NA04227]QKW05243.1 phosphatase PAP2 family protein [Streptomyces sp. NA04227]
MPPSSATPTPRPALTAGFRVTRAAMAVLAAATAVLMILVGTDWQPLQEADSSVVTRLHRWALEHRQLTDAQRILTDWVWDPWTMRALTAVVAVYLLWRGDRRPALWLVLTCLGAALVQQGLKAAFDRPRPDLPQPVDHASYSAFPSGHAMTATAVLGALLWLLHRYGAPAPLFRLALGFTVVSVLGVGVTRVWLGVHWPSDVVGGWLLGILTVAAATAVGDGLSARRRS